MYVAGGKWILCKILAYIAPRTHILFISITDILKQSSFWEYRKFEAGLGL